MNSSVLLTREQGAELVRLARQALQAAIGGKDQLVAVVDSRLDVTGATFVTLTIDGVLRGCIGTPEAHASLVDDVQHNAVRAATMDPRFRPVSVDELPRIHIEVSVLTHPQLLACAPAQRPDHVKGLGLLLTSGFFRGLLLPQVWEKIADPADFMGILCQKAGLSPTAWQRADTELFTFQVQAFHEG